MELENVYYFIPKIRRAGLTFYRGQGKGSVTGNLG